MCGSLQGEVYTVSYLLARHGLLPLPHFLPFPGKLSQPAPSLENADLAAARPGARTPQLRIRIENSANLRPAVAFSGFIAGGLRRFYLIMPTTLKATARSRRSTTSSRGLKLARKASSARSPSPEISSRRTRGAGTRLLVVAKTPDQRRRLARSVATELNRELVRVNLGEVIGKVSGETEKNLKKIFAGAETSGAVLFFDEADALFGKRSGIKQAHDRYANLDVSFLLRQIESSRAVVLLAAKSTTAFDPELIRRLRVAMKITPPKPARTASSRR